MNWLLLRNRSVLKAGSKKVTKHTGKGLPVIEMLEDRVTPATALFDSVSGILSLDLAGAESMLVQDANTSGKQLLVQMDSGQKLDIKALPIAIVASSTSSSAVLNLDAASADDIKGLKINYGTKTSNLVTFGDMKPVSLLDISLVDNATSGTNTVTIGGAVDLSAKDSSFVTDSTANAGFAQKLTFQLYGKIDAGKGNIRLASKLSGTGVSNLEVNSPDSPDLKATDITIAVAGSIGYDKSGRIQPIELQSAGAISITTTDNPVQLKSVSGPNTFSLLELGTGTATIYGDFKTKAAEVIGNQTTVEFDTSAILSLGGDETLRTIIGKGTLNLGNSNGYKLTLNTTEFKAYDGLITGGTTGLLTIAGVGTQELSGANTYSGGTEVKSGATLQLIATGAAGTGEITVRDGGTLNLKGNVAPANKVTITGKGVGSTNLGALQNLSGNNTLAGTLAVSGDSLVTVPAGSLKIGAVSLSGNLTTYSAVGTTLLFSGVINDGSGIFGLKTTGTGPVTLASANTFDGGVDITEGTTTITDGAALGTAAAQVRDGASLIIQGGTFTIANNLSILGNGFGGIGAIQNFSGTNSIKGDITVNKASLISVKAGSNLNINGKALLGGELTLNAEGGTTLTVNGQIDDGASTFGVTTQGTGAVVLTNANLYNGTTTVGAGSSVTLAEVAGTSKGALASPGVILTNNASQFIFKRSDAEGTPFIFSPIISGPGTVTVETGAVQYNTTQAYTGTTTLKGSTVLQVGDTTTNGWIDPASTINDGGKLIFQRNDTKTIPNYIYGSGNVIFRSTGTFTLATDNDYQGGTTIEPGTTLILASARGAGTGTISITDTGDLRFNGSVTGSMTVNNAISAVGQGRDNKGVLRNILGNNNLSGTITLGSSIFIGTSPGVGNDLTVSGLITDGTKFYGITLFGEGKLILTNTNAYDGNTNLFQADLVLRDGKGAGPTGTILINSGNSLYLNPLSGGAMTLSNTVNLAGFGRGNVGAIVNENGANTIDGNVYLNASSTISALPSTTLTLLSTLDDDTNTYDLNLQGGGTIVLGVESLYDGITTIKNGTTGILAAKNAAGVGSMVVEIGATLGLRGGISAVNNITVGGTGVGGLGAIRNLTGDNTLTGKAILSADTLIDVANGTKLTWTGVIDDGAATYGVSLQGTGNLVLTGNNLFNGKTVIAPLTTLTLGAGGISGSLSSSEVANAGILAFNRTDIITAPFVFNPLISGAGAVLINTGAVQFVNDNTFTGTTTIAASATLIVGNASTKGSLVGDIINNGALWYRRTGANPVIIGATITGTGTVTFKDTATYRLTKANNWSGLTTIDSGATVEVGDGTISSTGAISSGFGATAVGSIVANGVLVFNAGGNNRFVNQTISGSGTVTYQGNTSYTVSGTNTYSGITTIQSAEAILTSAAVVSTNTIKVLDGGTLGLDTKTAIKLNNAIEVTGAGYLAGGAIRSLNGANEIAGTVKLTGATTISNQSSDKGSLLFSNMISGTNNLTIAGPSLGVYLTAANTYSGKTTINNGSKLVLGNGTGNTGSLASSGVANNGTFQFNRLDSRATPYKFTAPISGTGVVDILSGAVIFTGNNTFTGLTTIYLGATLIIGDGSSNGTIVSNIVDNGLLIFDVTLGSSALPGVVIPGTISGTGDVQFRQTGPYTLTADNSYGGTTTIDSGATVQFGNGGATGSVTGAITNNGNLIFNRSSNLVVGQNITSSAGFGSVTYKGTAQYTVSGVNTYNLGTTVSGAATLVMVSNTAAGSGGITVNSGASLALKGASALTVNNPITVGGTGALDAGAIQNLANNNTLTGGIILTANTKVALAGGGTLKTTGVISGSYGLSTSGSGKLLTTTNNSYTGDTTIGAGTTLQLGENTATGSLASLAIVNNGALVFNRTDVAASPLNVMALVSGSGTVAVNSGAVQFSNDNTYTGATTIVSGASLLVGNKAAAGAIYQPTGVGTVTNNGALIFQRSDGSFASPLAINTTISGSGKVTYQSGGVFQANGVNSYSGGTTIQSDTVLILASNSAAGTGDITVVSSGTLGLTGGITLANKIIGGGSGVGGSAGFIQNLSGTNILTGQVTLTSGAIFSIQAGSTLRVNGTITDGASSFGISAVGGGRLELPTVNSYDGGTVISQGTLMVGQAGSAGTGGIQISAGSTLELNNATGFNLTNSIQTAGTISAVGGNHTLSGTEVLTGNTTYLNNGTILTVSGAISDGAGIFGLVSQGTGTLKLLSANSYDGNTQVQQGTVVLANSNSAGSGLGTILAASGATLNLSGTGLNVINAVQVAGSISNTGGTNTLSGPVTLTANVAVLAGSTTTLNFGGIITDGLGKFSINANGLGTIGLNKGNSFDGGVNVNAGAVVLRNSTAAGTGSIVVAHAAAVVMEGASLTVGNPITVVGTGLSNGGALVNTGGSNTLTGQVTLGGNTLFNVASNLTIQQGIKETAVSGLSLGGSGRLILSGANLYTGGTTVAVGSTLQVGDGKTGTVIGNILDNGAVEFNYGGVEVISGVISGTGTLLFTGGGKFTLTGANTLSGVTTINPGATVMVGDGLGGGTLPGNLIDNGQVVFDNPAVTAISQIVSGTGSIVYKGGAKYTVTGANTYTGGTQVFAGNSVVLTSGSSAGVGGLLQVADGATLFLNPTAASMKLSNPLEIAGGGTDGVLGALQNLKGSNTLTGAVALTGPATRVNPGSSTLAFTGVISQSGVAGAAFNLVGNVGTVLMAGDNSYTGTTLISAGTTLQLGSGGSTGSIQSSAIYDNGSLIFNRPGVATTLAAKISGDGTVTVASGAVTLTGENSYRGITTVLDSGSLTVGDGKDSGSIAASDVVIAGNGILAFSRAGDRAVSNRFSGTGTLSLQSTGVYTVSADSPNFGGLLEIGSQATASVNADFSKSNANVSGTLSGTGTLGLVSSQAGSYVQPGPGAGQRLNIEGLNPTTGKGAVVFDIYGNQQPVTNDYLRGTSSSSAFNIEGLQLIVNGEAPFSGNGFVQKLIENGPGGTVSGFFVDASGKPIDDGGKVQINGTSKTAVIDYSFGPDNNDVALLFVENLVYSLYTYNQQAGTLDLQLGEDTNLTVTGDSNAGFTLTLSDNLTGRNIGWVQEGGDANAAGSTTTSAVFNIPNLSALNITQRADVGKGSNTVAFGDTAIAFFNPSVDSGLKVDLPFASGTIDFSGATLTSIDGLTSLSVKNGSVISQGTGLVNFGQTLTAIVNGTIDLGALDNTFSGVVTLSAASVNLASATGLILGDAVITGSLTAKTAGGIGQANGTLVRVSTLQLQAMGAVTLTNGGNDFDTLEVSGSGELAVQDLDSLNVSQLEKLTGGLRIVTGGGLILPGGKIQTVGGQTYDAGSSDISISGSQDNHLVAQGQTISFQAGNVSTAGNLLVEAKAANLLISSVSALSHDYKADVTSNNLAVFTLGGPVVFEGNLVTSSLSLSGNGSFRTELLGGGTIDSPVNFTGGNTLVLGDSATDTFLFKGGFSAKNQVNGAPSQLAGLFQTNRGTVELQNLMLSANATIDTYYGNSIGNTILLNGTQDLGGRTLTLRGTGDAISGSNNFGLGRVNAEKGVLTLGGGTSTSTGDFLLSGNVPGTGYAQLKAGLVTLSNVDLGVQFGGGFIPPLAATFKIVDNTGTQKVNGTFNGLPEGSDITVGGDTLRISYVGGDGNDITLTNTRTLPTPTGPKIAEPFSLRATSVVAGVGGGMISIKSAGGAEQFVEPFPGYTGSLNMTTVDRSGDGIADSIAVMVAGGAQPAVKVIDAATGREAASFYAFAPEFLGGGTLASGVVNLNGQLESVILIGAGSGAEPSVTVFNAFDFLFERAFYAYAQQYKGGVTVGVTSPDPTGTSLIITGSAINSHVVLFDINQPTNALASWYAFAPSTLLQQMTVAGGDLTNDGFSEVLVGAATGWPASVAVFNTRSLVNPNDPNRYAAEKAFYAFPPNSPNFTTGVRVGVSDVNGDGKLDVLAGSGPDVSGVLNAIDYETLDYLFSNPIPTLQGVTVASNLTTATLPPVRK